MDEIIALGLDSGHDERFAELAMPSALRTRGHHHSGVVGARSCYPANIAAACYEANVALHREQPQPVKVEDELQREKRRKSNRLSAQRWRMRKRSKFSELQEQIYLLQKDQQELELENSKLKAEFKLDLALAKKEAAQKSSQLAACPPKNPRPAYYQNVLVGHRHKLEWMEKTPQCLPHGYAKEESARKSSQLAAACPPENPRPAYYQNVSLDHRHKLEWLERTPQGILHGTQGYALASASQQPFPEGANNVYSYNMPRSNIGHVGRFMMPISDATHHPMFAQQQQPNMARSDTFGFPQGSGVSHAQLQNMIRTANTAPYIS